ncbi:MAG: starch-binding protein [Clostridia bacterium]|nr:starch-binding protein [Clostridia bacterium]
MKRRIISAALAGAMLASIPMYASVPASADTADYGLPSRTADGVILHCFDWSYNAIRENLPLIAAAGYTTVQTSPVQQPKDYGEWLNAEGQWWKLYQPLSFSIAENSWLGTKDELKAMCEEAEKYGIKVICDIVSNHMANQDGSAYDTISVDIEKYEKKLFDGFETYFHHLKKDPTDTKLEYIVQGSLSKLPDLNTSDKYVQERVISLLEDCIDCGVDGFRFDAAKHIETPNDGDYASDFWPNVINTATQYAEDKGVELYCYGEILNSPGSGRNVKDYTQYLDITDNKAGDRTLYNIYEKDAEKVVLAQQYTYTDDDPSNYVLWAESHDTYMGSSGAGGFQNTSGIKNADIVKAWAIVASRAKSHALYFARPNNIMGLAGDSTWKSTAVTEINKFHNKYIGTDDEVFSERDVVAVRRGDSGIVLVNLGSDSYVSIDTKGMKDGSYIDAVTGSAFLVKDGTISGTIGESGVAVVYEGAATSPKVLFSAEDTSFKTATYKLTLTAENAQTASYSINGGEAIAFTDSVEVKLGENVEEGSTITVTATASAGDKTFTETHSYLKEKVDHSGVFAYFDNTKNKFSEVYAYAFYETVDDAGSKTLIAKNGEWPGVKVDFDDELGLYAYEVPSDIPIGKGCIIFNNGSGKQTENLLLEYNINYCDDIKEKKFKEYDPDGITLIYGDVSGDTAVTSEDALAILIYSSDPTGFTDEQKAQADVDLDGQITSADALSVLCFSANIKDENSKAGEEFVFGGRNTTDSDADKDSDNGSSPDIKPSGTIFYALNTAGWIFDDGCKLWIYNTETKQAVEMTKQDMSNDKSDYSYVDMPQG